MECENNVENGLGHVQSTERSRVVGWQFQDSSTSDLRLDVTTSVLGAGNHQQMHISLVTDHTSKVTKAPNYVLPAGFPFMNNMDEITYWIYTKRAPCLMNYDNLIKEQTTEAQSLKTEIKNVHSPEESPSPKKKKKRKLSILDDDSVSTEKQQNVYFEVSQKQNSKNILSNHKSESLGSDLNFNIKNSSVQGKPKRTRVKKNCRTTLHKKNKIVTSTPKVTANLRRSLRQAQQSVNNSHLNSSFEIYNSSVINGNKYSYQKPTDKQKNSCELLASGDHNNKKYGIANIKSAALNGQFEDLSDVSGFTANYIRSTKMSKAQRKLTYKSSRNVIKARHNIHKGNTVVCVNKGVNTGTHKSNVLNCSTDSSQNVINLVTNKDKSIKVNKSTSLLKFIDTKKSQIKDSVSKKDSTNKRNKTNFNTSFQSKNSTSRYPKRYKNHSPKDTSINNNNRTNKSADKRRKVSKNSSDFNNSDRKENPEDKLVYRTRSGRNIGLKLRQPENSVLVLSNSTEHVSSMASMNVASHTTKPKEKLKKKKHISKYVQQTKKSLDKTGSFKRDSLRDKTGFTACFSDSDEESGSLNQRKYFCP